jgi:hypothetical protein
MGGNTSKSAVQQTNEFFNKTTNSFMSSNSQQVQASSLNSQNMDFSGAKFKGCKAAFIQSINSTVVASGKMTTQNINDLTAKLKNDAQTQIDNAASQKSGFLAPSVANSASATTDLKTKVTNIIENTMKSETVQKIFANANNIQNLTSPKLEYECDPAYRTPGAVCSSRDQSGCDFVADQNIVSNVTAKGVADALTKAMTDLITENTTDTTVKQTAKQETQGLNDLVDSVFKGLTGIWGIIALVVCVLICGALIFLMSPAGQNATRTAANTAASRYGGKF